MSLRSKLLIDKFNRMYYYKHEMLILLYKSIIYDESLDKDFRFFVFLKLTI